MKEEELERWHQTDRWPGLAAGLEGYRHQPRGRLKTPWSAEPWIAPPAPALVRFERWVSLGVERGPFLLGAPHHEGTTTTTALAEAR